MSFKTPTAFQYLGSLLIAGILCLVAFFALSSQGITDMAYFLAVGLILGHLVGSFSSQPQAAHVPGAPADETTSLYVGNIAYRAKRENLEELFSQFGKVKSVRIMTDRATHKPRGYGFVEMDSLAAQQAIRTLNDREFFGRNLRVSEAKQRPGE